MLIFLPDDLDLTMLRQISCRSRVDALLYDKNMEDNLAGILQPVQSADSSLDPSSQAGLLKNATLLETEDYNALLNYLTSTGQPYRAHTDFPHPLDAHILPPYAVRCPKFHWNGQTYSTQASHEGNSAIQLCHPITNTLDTGYILQIWTLPLEGAKQMFFIVCIHHPLPANEEARAPFIGHTGLMTRIVDAAPTGNLVIIEASHIVTHLTTFRRPKGTYGIDKDTLVVCWALNRGWH